MPRYPSPSEIFHGNQETITDEEKVVLDLIWKTFLKRGESIPEKALFKKIPALAEPHWEGNPWTRLQNRPPPRLFYAREWHGYRDISPTFLGMLYSGRGKRLEYLLVQYLQWLQGKAKGTRAPEKVTAKQVMKALKIKEAEAFELCHAIIKGGFAPVPRKHQDPKSWRLLLPYDIEDILKEDDVPMVVIDRAMCKTNPPWSPSFQKTYSKLDSVAAQRLQINGIGDEACMEEVPKSTASKGRGPRTQGRSIKGEKDKLPAISEKEIETIKGMMKKLGGMMVADKLGISKRSLHYFLDGKAGPAVHEAIVNAKPLIASFAQLT